MPRRLHRERVDYVLVGGYAVIIHGFPRFTQDVDLFVNNDLSYEIVELDGIPVRVATPESLYKMKCNTVRPQDRLDAAFLKRLLEQHQEP